MMNPTEDMGAKMMRLISIVAFAALCACQYEWELPEVALLTCTSDSDCPETYECADSLYCTNPAKPACGNGVVEVGEKCDYAGDASKEDVCPYGEETCIVCSAQTCQYEDRSGTWCGDGVVQQRGLHNGDHTGEWEACDSEASVSCSDLHPALGSGTATCQSNCVAYDISDCENQSVVYVPAGPFMMGCNEAMDATCDEDEYGYHQVTLDAFVIDRYEVTAGDYREWCLTSASCEFESNHVSFLSNDGYSSYHNYARPERVDYPMNFVTWFEANDYCIAMGKRLPTEAEWEKTARGTDGRVYPWGFDVPTCERSIMNGWYQDPEDPNASEAGWIVGDGCGKNRMWPVGSLPSGASPYGAEDMSGNAWEWVWDFYDADYYQESPTSNPTGPDEPQPEGILRGGSFNRDPFFLRVSYRLQNAQTNRSRSLGFRCVSN